MAWIYIVKIESCEIYAGEFVPCIINGYPEILAISFTDVSNNNTDNDRYVICGNLLAHVGSY